MDDSDEMHVLESALNFLDFDITEQLSVLANWLL
jgi:hypothetical protein